MTDQAQLKAKKECVDLAWENAQLKSEIIRLKRQQVKTEYELEQGRTDINDWDEEDEPDLPY